MHKSTFRRSTCRFPSRCVDAPEFGRIRQERKPSMCSKQPLTSVSVERRLQFLMTSYSITPGTNAQTRRALSRKWLVCPASSKSTVSHFALHDKSAFTNCKSVKDIPTAFLPIGRSPVGAVPFCQQREHAVAARRAHALVPLQATEAVLRVERRDQSAATVDGCRWCVVDDSADGDDKNYAATRRQTRAVCHAA